MSITTDFLKKRSASFRMTILGGSGLAVCFFVFYFLVGLHYLSIERNRGEGYHDNDLYFQADSEYLVMKLFSSRGYYKRALFHPLFPVIFNPSARAMQGVITNPYVITSLYCALFGAVCVLGAVYFFYHLSIPWPRSLIYASLFGISGSTLVFSTIPDTYIFSAAGLIVLLILVLRKAPVWCWAIVSVYLIGVNVINIVFVAIAAFYALFLKKDQWLPTVEDMKRPATQRAFFKYASQTGLLFAGLVLIQKVALKFWVLTNPKTVLKDAQFLFIPENIAEAAGQFYNLVNHMLYFNIIAAQPVLVTHLRNPDLHLVSFRNVSWFDYPAFAWPSVFIWTSIMLLAAWSILHYKLYQQPIVKIGLLCLLANGIIFYLYGDDMMLYSCEWTFFLLLLVIIGIEKFLQHRRVAQVNLLLVLFLAMVLLNNLYFQWKMFSFHQF
uniref:Uncharacterized protein n=1 Tax=Roseihalotalea indica TaxID=2867963 RepID=A0AA49GJQ7_9BACT|nr:hypothetical protein K4G66_24260 [Tunicatimonas sp. TK19036]